MAILCNGTMDFFGYKMKWLHFTQKSGWIHDLDIGLFLYVTPVFLLMGTFGNLLSIIVFLQPAMSSLASRSRFILISIMDVIILYGCMLPIFLGYGNFRGNCNLEVNYINTWIQVSLVMTDAWMLALVTFERAMAIFRPLSTWTSNENRKRCCSWVNGTLIALPFISSFLNLPLLFQPILNMTLLYSFANTVIISNTILSTAVPFVLMLFLDIAILIKLYGSPLSGLRKEKEEKKGWITRIRRKAIRKKQRSNPGGSSDLEASGRETTQSKTKMSGNHCVTAGRKSARSRAVQSIKMILIVDIVAILLSAPLVMMILFKVKDGSLTNIARFAIYLRHAINFIFYFISSQFRREAIAVLCCRSRRSDTSGASSMALSTVASRVNM